MQRAFGGGPPQASAQHWHEGLPSICLYPAGHADAHLALGGGPPQTSPLDGVFGPSQQRHVKVPAGPL
jgi:hypothetical protein